MGVVYKITNRVNQKFYIGKTIRTAAHRWGQHKACVTTGKGDCYLYRAMRKHGWENFTIEVIDQALLDEELCAKEMEWIAKLGCAKRAIGYNSTLGGQSGIPTEESLQKRRGQKRSPEACRRMSEAQKGKPKNLTEETRRRLSLARKGVPVSPERAAAMKAKPPGLGTKRTEESKRKIGESNRKLWTTEKRAEMSQKQKDRHEANPFPAPVLTPEGRARVTEATRGKWASMTPEERSARCIHLQAKGREAMRKPENIEKRNAAIKAAWTPEKRAAWAEKMRPRLVAQAKMANEAAVAAKLARKQARKAA